MFADGDGASMQTTTAADALIVDDVIHRSLVYLSRIRCIEIDRYSGGTCPPWTRGYRGQWMVLWVVVVAEERFVGERRTIDEEAGTSSCQKAVHSSVNAERTEFLFLFE